MYAGSSWFVVETFLANNDTSIHKKKQTKRTIHKKKNIGT